MLVQKPEAPNQYIPTSNLLLRTVQVVKATAGVGSASDYILGPFKFSIVYQVSLHSMAALLMSTWSSQEELNCIYKK